MSEPLKPYVPTLDLTVDRWLATWTENVQREFLARRVQRTMQHMTGSRCNKSVSFAMYTSESSISRGRFCLRSVCKQQQAHEES